LENDLLNNLREVVEDSRLFQEEDKWWWKAEEGGVFTRKSNYRVLEKLLILEDRWSGGIICSDVFGKVQLH